MKRYDEKEVESHFETQPQMLVIPCLFGVYAPLALFSKEGGSA